jgi:hypothetical protein
MNEQMEIIQQHKDKIPQIEIDLFMSNVRDLYEACISLNKLNMSHDVPAPPAIAESEALSVDEIPIRETIRFMAQVEESPDLTEPIPEETPNPGPEETDLAFETEEFADEDDLEAEPDILPETEPATVFQPQSHFVPEPEPEPLIESQVTPEPVALPEPEPEYEPIVLISPKPEPVAEIRDTASMPSPDPRPVNHPSQDLFSTGTTIADKLKEEKMTLNQRLQAEKPKMNIGSQLHHNQIRDLKSSIGINEKFQFINDLFKGNMQDYTLAITQLNQFNNFEEALEYIDILKFKYTWDINSDAHHKLMDFVRRRYL